MGAVEARIFAALTKITIPMFKLFDAHSIRSVIKIIAVILVLFALVNIFG